MNKKEVENFAKLLGISLKRTAEWLLSCDIQKLVAILVRKKDLAAQHWRFHCTPEAMYVEGICGDLETLIAWRTRTA